ncbi:MAG: hypothetical protein OEY00_13650, partial [Gammaproteobacteria bacterium]|nr:hypothetical protein [Gammaproteobacteria bacterium]
EYVNGSRKVNKNYPHWELRSLNGSNTVYTIVLKTESGGTLTLHEFHYALMEVRKGGYANLNMSRSNTSRDCQ